MTAARRPADVSVHDWQHRLIDSRMEQYRSHRQLTQMDALLRRESYKRAHNTLDGHLRQFHDYRHTIGPPVPLDRLEALHLEAHAS